MKLHCIICSLQGTHMSEDSEIATIDETKLKLPLTPDMFTSSNPDRGIPAPWMPGVDWQTMFCPNNSAHLPWGIEYKDTEQAIQNGGPRRILTDKGMLDVPVVGKVKENPNSQIFICKKCGREIKSRLAFANHYKACKGETK